MSRLSGLALYSASARDSASPVIRRYSTSFRVATALCPRRCRASIGAVYALVRVADEIVDGTAAEAGLDLDAQRDRLDELEEETFRAVATGFSANLVVHAFADVARRSGIEEEPIRAFFASMRRDLDPVDFDEDALRRYIHGSAEAVGVMCLRVFTTATPVDSGVTAQVEEGAIRLGAAFQKVNFLRDLAHDSDGLGRQYFPGMHSDGLTDAQKDAITADIRADLDAARRATALLPRDCRRGVRVATALFAELLRRIERVPAHRLMTTRISVPTVTKAALVARWGLFAGRRATGAGS